MSARPVKSGTVVVISGPSGVGKGTICRELLKRLDNAYLSVSVTSRPKTEKEVDGRDYWFVSYEEFQNRVGKGLLLEYAEVFGNFYGTPKDKLDEALAANKIAILEIDVQGGKQVKQIYPEAVMIFILAPNQKELAGRLFGRARDDEKTANKRLSRAQTEIEAAQRFYEHRVINDNLQDAVSEIIGIIETERTRKRTVTNKCNEAMEQSE
ncbi:MAG: guanylate kinase [Sedimentisphaerales bacterium]|nr:guanylate kinase [Sedimentisphaerales bacterium]